MNAPDPLDAASAQLFAALREERLPEGAEQRALSAALEAFEARPRAAALGRPLLWGGLFAAGALAAGVALSLRSAVPAERISAEPASARRALRVEHPESSAADAPSAPARVAPLAPPPPPAPSQAARVTLGEELGALKAASAALSAGDAGGALRALDRYEHVLKGKQLRTEATLLKIEALSRTGQAAAASALAEQFVKQHPDSPLIDRARSYVQQQEEFR